MNEQAIVSKMHEYLHTATKELCAWLAKMLPRVGEEWWQVCVMDNLSFAQKQYATESGYSKLEDLDLAAMLRVADKSWYDMRSFAYLPTRDRQCVRDMMKVRNNWAHLAGAIADKDIVLRDLDTILAFFENVMVTNKYTQGIEDFRREVENADFSAVFETETVKKRIASISPEIQTPKAWCSPSRTLAAPSDTKYSSTAKSKPSMKDRFRRSIPRRPTAGWI